jgi:hypothetical protein
MEVYDGSFSAKLESGTTLSDGGLVMIGPLNYPLIMFTDARITFWAYHLTSSTARAYVNLVMDNDRVIEGVTSVSVSGAAVQCENTGGGCLGFTSSDIWIQMKPSGGWYTSVVGDPVLAPVAACTLATPCTLAFWQSKFLTTKVIQVQIDFGFDHAAPPSDTIYIDNVAILNVPAPIEPEVIAA